MSHHHWHGGNRANRAVGHEKGHASVPLRTPLMPSGGVYTSARDLAAYTRFHLQRGRIDGKPLLKEDLWQEMHGFGLGGDYGLGVIREERRYGDTPVRLFSHQGGGFGFGSVFYYCPEAGLAWAALFNRPADAAYSFGKALVNNALDRRWGERAPRLASINQAPIKPTPSSLRQIVGTYVARNGTAKLSLQDGALNFQEDQRRATMQLTSPDQLFTVAPDQEVVTYRYFSATQAQPAHLECSIGEDSLDYNDGPSDPLGPDNPNWSGHVGRYAISQWGVPAEEVTIRQHNGYLYLNEMRLITEVEPGLFFTSDGEAVDFRQAAPTWKNLRLQRKK